MYQLLHKPYAQVDQYGNDQDHTVSQGKHLAFDRGVKGNADHGRKIGQQIHQIQTVPGAIHFAQEGGTIYDLMADFFIINRKIAGTGGDR